MKAYLSRADVHHMYVRPLDDGGAIPLALLALSDGMPSHTEKKNPAQGPSNFWY